MGYGGGGKMKNETGNKTLKINYIYEQLLMWGIE
jgi:hypothetical protein